MKCENCGEPVRVRKSLKRGKSNTPEECPDCGASLEEKRSDTRLEK